MRLTLRTLLAYLDDTLDANQMKAIGQKVAESDTAQELITRIKQVTRRRRLTTPPETGTGSKLDPNVIAQYLDNTLSEDQVAEVEQVSLGSDVHLAEIAACHQILTLILGEPMLVPPTSYQRMYQLVKGREAIPFRRPPEEGEDAEDQAEEAFETDETLRLGLPALHSKGGNWRNYIIFAIGSLAAVLLLGLALFQALIIPEAKPKPKVVGVDNKEKQVVQLDKKQTPNNKKPENNVPVKVDLNKNDPVKVDPNKNDPNKNDPNKNDPNKNDPNKNANPTPPQVTILEYAEADNTPQFIGAHQPAKEYPDVLLRKNPKLPNWRVVDKNQKQVFSGERLVSLPGFDCHILTSTGVKLNLRGVIKEEQLPPSENVRESVITIHKNDKMALDLTFHRGRIFLTNDTDTPKYIRVRFADTTVPSLDRYWDLQLHKDSNVMLEKWARFSLVTTFDPNRPAKQRVGPNSYMQMVVFKGEVDFIHDKLAKRLAAPKNGKPSPAWVRWDSQSGNVPDPIDLDSIISMEQITQLNLADKDAKFQQQWKSSQEQIHAANKRIAIKLSDTSANSSPELVWQSLLSSKDVAFHILGVRCLGATEDIGKLRELLGQPKNPNIRSVASDTLRFWMGSDRNNEDILYAELKKVTNELKADKIMSLLFSFKSTLDIPAQRKETFLHLVSLLNADSLIIRDLAHEQLYERIPKMMRKELFERNDKKGFDDFSMKYSKALSIPYDAEGTSESWEAAQMMWADLINGDLLMPPKKK